MPFSFESRPGTSSSVVPQRLSTPYHQEGSVDVSARQLPGRLTRDRVPLDRRIVGEEFEDMIHERGGHQWGLQRTAEASGLIIDDDLLTLIPQAPRHSSSTRNATRRTNTITNARLQRKQVLPWEEPINSSRLRSSPRVLSAMVTPPHSHLLDLIAAPFAPSNAVSEAVSLETSMCDVDAGQKKVRFVMETPSKKVPAALGSVRKRNSFREAMAGSPEQRADFGRRSSRALFLERMDILKRTLESTVDDVTQAFDFDKNPDQLRALNEIIKGVDGAVLGQEYLTAHPMQPTVSLVGQTNVQMEALISGMKRPAPVSSQSHHNHGGEPHASSLDMNAVRRVLHSAASTSTTLSPVDSPVMGTSGLGRQTSSYYLQVAEEKRKTGAGAVGNQLYIAAEALELRNASQLGLLIPKHDTALSELEVLGLL